MRYEYDSVQKDVAFLRADTSLYSSRRHFCSGDYHITLTGIFLGPIVQAEFLRPTVIHDRDLPKGPRSPKKTRSSKTEVDDGCNFFHQHEILARTTYFCTVVSYDRHIGMIGSCVPV